MPPVELLIPFIVASALLSLAPGPDNIFVLTQSALFGRRHGVMVTLGLCSGLMVHTTAVAFGVAAVFQASERAFTALTLMGAAYLMYLGWQALSASVQKLGEGQAKVKSAAQLYGRGVIMNLTNPKVSIFFLAFLPQFAVPENGSLDRQLLVLGAVFMCVALLIFIGIAMLAGTLGNSLQKSAKAQIYLNRLAAAVFIALAVKLLLSAK